MNILAASGQTKLKENSNLLSSGLWNWDLHTATNSRARCIEKLRSWMTLIIIAHVVSVQSLIAAPLSTDQVAKSSSNGANMQTKQSCYASDSDNKPSGNVAIGEAAPEVAVGQLLDENNKRITALVLHTPETKYSDNGIDRVRLRHGEVLVDAKQIIVIESNGCCINVDKGATVLIESQPYCLKVRNLSDSHKNSVSVQFDMRKMTIAPGQECILAVNEEVICRVAGMDQIARRCLELLTPQQSIAILSDDFHPVSLIRRSPLMHALTKRHERVAVALQSRLCKTVAALAIATSSRGPYEVIAPVETAMVGP